MIKCQNIVYVSNGYKIVQLELRQLKELRDTNEYNINDSQRDIIDELIHVEIDAIM